MAADNGHSATTAAALAAAAAAWTAGGARRTGTLGSEGDNAGSDAGADAAGSDAPLTGRPGDGGSGALWAGRRTDPLVDSGSVGLRMFNLGTIPASVTPPRSWRRAAWFTVAASMAALAGLVVLGALLVGPTQERGQTTALPYFPDGKPLATLGSPTSTNAQSGLRLPLPSSGSGPNNDLNSRPGDPRDPITDVGDTRALPSTPIGVGTTPGVPVNPPTDTSAPVVEAPPSITTVNSSADPAVDPTELMKRTRTFFAEVTSNAQAAADLTSGAVHDDAVALIEQKYGDVSTIQIQSMSLDPSSGLTVSALRLANKDGTTQTQQTTLHFTLTGDPKITNPGG